MRNSVATILAVCVCLAAAAIAFGAPVEMPSAPKESTNDQCAMMNHYHGSATPPGRCVVLGKDTGGPIYYVYFNTETCQVGGHNAPAIGVWKETNGQAGLQTGTGSTKDFGELSTCGTWSPP